MNTDKNQIIANALMNIEPMPLVENKKPDLKQYVKIPFGSLASLGAMFTPFTKTVQEVVTSGGGNLYRAVDYLGNIMTLPFARKDGSGYAHSYKIGDSLKNASFVPAESISSKATSLVYNPNTLFMGAAMISMQKEISDIKETQQQIIDFIHDDKLASLKGDLLYLGTVINDYQYNLDSDTYKATAHVKVQDILQNAKRNVLFYAERINRLADKDSFLVVDKSIKNTLDKMISEFSEYRLALYLYGFSSFLNVMLLENFNEDYLNSIIDRLEDCSYQYRELYTKCYNLIEEQTGKSLDTLAADLAADAAKGIGNLIAKLPLANRVQLDEKLIKAHDSIDAAKSEKNSRIAETLIANRNGGVQTFIDNLRHINQMYNHPTEILFDNKNMYIKLIA